MKEEWEEELQHFIESRSTFEPVNQKVTYDLDFSMEGLRSKDISLSLSKVFFEKDANKWFSVVNDEIYFVPDYRVTIKFHVKRGMKANSLTGYFEKFLRSVCIIPKFEALALKTVRYNSSLGQLLIFNPLGLVIDRATEMSNRKEAFYSHIMEDILGNIDYLFRQ